MLLLVLAVVQGLTEYLPISSSGHLVLIREFFGGGALPEDATVEVLLHVGTLLAVLFFYRREIARLCLGVLGGGEDPAGQRHLFLALGVGLLPLFLVLPVKDWLEENLYTGTLLPSVALLVTGGMLWATRWLPGGSRDGTNLPWTAAFLVGCAQALAITPGISRSGSTIVAGLALGMSIDGAAAFSFLLSIPAVGGAAFLKALEAAGSEGAGGIPPGHAVLAVAVSAVVGWLALGLLLWIARARRLAWFAPYCWLAGLAGVVLTLTLS